MTTYATFHFVAMHGFMLLGGLFVAALVFAGIIWIAALLNHWVRHRKADREEREYWQRHGGTWPSAGRHRPHDAFTKHRRQP